jgi:hypothetical protein
MAADAAPLPAQTAERPWYVSAVLGFAGWLASLFAFLFVWLLFEPDTAAASALAGAIMLGAGFALYIVNRDSAFFEQLALALSLAGQIALVWAAVEATDSATAGAAFATVMQAALLAALPNRFAKVLSAFFMCVAWALTVRFAWWGETGFADPPVGAALAPALIGWFVIWTPIAVGAHILIAREARWMASGARRILRPALTGLVLALALATWTSEPFANFQLLGAPGATRTNWLALWPLLAVAAALFGALCAFRLRHGGLIGIAIAGALLHLVQFYYLLGVTLMVKSYIMLVVGIILLLAARRLRHTGGDAR